MRSAVRIAACLACLPLAACDKDDKPAASAPRPVLATKIQSPLSAGAAFAGVVEARYQTARGFQVLGRIESFDVDVGDSVRKGEHLAKLDPTSLQLDVNSKIGDLAKAEARMNNAASTLERTQRLVASGSSTQARLDADVQAHAAAQASLEQAKAELDKAKTRVGYTVLTSDEDGVVVSKDADVGRTVNAGEPVMTVARTDVREVVIDTPDDMAGALKIGDRFRLSLQVDPSVTAEGAVREVAPQSDAATRTRRIRITLERPPEPFRLGATVTAEPLGAPEKQTAFRIPSSALLDGGATASVFVVDPQTQTVSSKPVKTAKGSASDVQVLEGLSAGQYVVVAGVSDLKDGEKVVFAEGAPK
jgi:membrane fusion protein, multidrug efflux system